MIVTLDAHGQPGVDLTIIFASCGNTFVRLEGAQQLRPAVRLMRASQYPAARSAAISLAGEGTTRRAGEAAGPV
jgi:hypothetical protein